MKHILLMITAVMLMACAPSMREINISLQEGKEIPKEIYNTPIESGDTSVYFGFPRNLTESQGIKIMAFKKAMIQAVYDNKFWVDHADVAMRHGATAKGVFDGDSIEVFIEIASFNYFLKYSEDSYTGSKSETEQRIKKLRSAINDRYNDELYRLMFYYENN